MDKQVKQLKTTDKMTTTMTNKIEEGMKLLTKPKQKLTAIVLGGGFMGCDVRKPIVTRGYVDTGSDQVLGFSYPRARKMFRLDRLLAAPCIMLKGHEESHPLFAPHLPGRDVGNGMSVRSYMLDGKGGRFVDAADDQGETLIAYLRKHLAVHTLQPDADVVLLSAQPPEGSDHREVLDCGFRDRLLDALGEPIDFVCNTPKVPTPRVNLFTDAMKRKLAAARDVEPPKVLYKLFLPEGASTWFVCSMEEDGDTLWVVADLGLGCVEYGTASLKDLETLRGPAAKLHVERDRYFDAAKLRMSVSELVQLDSLYQAE